MTREHHGRSTAGRSTLTESTWTQPNAQIGKRTLTEAVAFDDQPHTTRASITPADTSTRPDTTRRLVESGTSSAPAIGEPAAVQRSARGLPFLQLGSSVNAAPIQKRASGDAAEHDPIAIHEAAQRGIATSATNLPYIEQIQRSFGKHDVSGVKAHVSGAAAASAQEIGAQAYTTGDHVILGRGADLHTVAHEAAHVIHQRGGVQLAGGVGGVDDAYERHADAAADKVVRGESAESLLDERSGGGGHAAHGGGAVQCVWMKGPFGWSNDGRSPFDDILHEGRVVSRSDYVRATGDFAAPGGQASVAVSSSAYPSHGGGVADAARHGSVAPPPPPSSAFLPPWSSLTPLSSPFPPPPMSSSLPRGSMLGSDYASHDYASLPDAPMFGAVGGGATAHLGHRPAASANAPLGGLPHRPPSADASSPSSVAPYGAGSSYARSPAPYPTPFALRGTHRAHVPTSAMLATNVQPDADGLGGSDWASRVLASPHDPTWASAAPLSVDARQSVTPFVPDERPAPPPAPMSSSAAHHGYAPVDAAPAVTRHFRSPSGGAPPRGTVYGDLGAGVSLSAPTARPEPRFPSRVASPSTSWSTTSGGGALGRAAAYPVYTPPPATRTVHDQDGSVDSCSDLDWWTGMLPIHGDLEASPSAPLGSASHAASWMAPAPYVVPRVPSQSSYARPRAHHAAPSELAASAVARPSLAMWPGPFPFALPDRSAPSVTLPPMVHDDGSAHGGMFSDWPSAASADAGDLGEGPATSSLDTATPSAARPNKRRWADDLDRKPGAVPSTSSKKRLPDDAEARAAAKAELGRAADAAGNARNVALHAMLVARAADGDGTVLPTSTGPEQRGSGFDGAMHLPGEGNGTLEISEGKQGGFRLLRQVKGGRGVPKVATPIPITDAGAATSRLATDASVRDQVIGTGQGDGGVFERTRADGSTRILRNELSSLTSHLRASIDKMFRAMEAAVRNGGLDKSVEETVRRILSGEGGVIKIVLDIDQLPKRMARDTRDATLRLIEDALRKVAFEVAEVKTQIQIVMRRKHNTETDQEVQAL
jgi:hypothetical protein